MNQLERGQIKWDSTEEIADMKSRYIYNYRAPQIAQPSYNQPPPVPQVAYRQPPLPPPPQFLPYNAPVPVIQPSAGSQGNPPDNVHIANVIACIPYQRGECAKPEQHNGRFHVCAHCLQEKQKFHRHPEMNCYSLIGVPAKSRPTKF